MVPRKAMLLLDTDRQAMEEEASPDGARSPTQSSWVQTHTRPGAPSAPEETTMKEHSTGSVSDPVRAVRPDGFGSKQL